MIILEEIIRNILVDLLQKTILFPKFVLGSALVVCEMCVRFSGSVTYWLLRRLDIA